MGGKALAAAMPSRLVQVCHPGLILRVIDFHETVLGARPPDKKIIYGPTIPILLYQMSCGASSPFCEEKKYFYQ